MIISASRRTDIPSFYSEWFYNRIHEGFLCVRNPIYPRQISRIRMTPDVIDCIVFWTKNPIPMLPRLSELDDYTYYFQYTLTGYGSDMERNLPSKKDELIPAFIRLSEKIGAERIIWRYDPIVFSNRYTPRFHLETFAEYAELLKGYTEKCVISFVDIYSKNKKNMRDIGTYRIPNEELESFSKQIADIAHANGMTIASCAESIDLEKCGIEHNCCIDRELIEKLTGYRMKLAKDRSQRAECGCMESMDIGSYNTCLNGCRYCYANHDAASLKANCKLYDPLSPLLCSSPLTNADKITDRKMSSLKKEPLI